MIELPGHVSPKKSVVKGRDRGYNIPSIFREEELKMEEYSMQNKKAWEYNAYGLTSILPGKIKTFRANLRQ